MSHTNTVVSDQPNITFAIIKADAVKNKVSEKIVDAIVEAGFVIITEKEPRILKVSMAQTVKFYYEHVGRNYFPDLMKSLIDGCIPLILEYPSIEESAVTKLRRLIGAMNSRNAELGTIRGLYGGHLFNPDAPVAENAIHASDSLISVLNEIGIIFPELTEINSSTHGVFQLDQFQVGVTTIPLKIKILNTDFEDFCLKREVTDGSQINYGRDFYSYFRLHESILKDDPRLQTLLGLNEEKTIEHIKDIVQFV